MQINAFFDASYYKHRKKAVVAIFIKNVSNNRVIIRSAKVVKCRSSSKAEYLAFCKLVNYLVAKQEQSQLPLDVNISIYGDNLEVINCVINRKESKGICIQEAFVLSEKFDILSSNNRVTLMWVPRKQNLAHGALTKFKRIMKALNQKWFFNDSL